MIGRVPASLDAGVRVIDPDAFEFISQEDHLALVRRFAAALLTILGS